MDITYYLHMEVLRYGFNGAQSTGPLQSSKRYALALWRIIHNPKQHTFFSVFLFFFAFFLFFWPATVGLKS
jgi:hypothetical protein